jgi:VanZ family protein
MKNIIFKSIIKLYYLSLIVLLILYLFPGSIIGYLFYGDLDVQPNIVKNPIGTSINHFFYFFFLTFLGSIYNLNEKKFINSTFFLLALSIFLELFHFFIPNRAFELNDVIANGAGVIAMYLIFFLKKKFINEKI